MKAFLRTLFHWGNSEGPSDIISRIGTPFWRHFLEIVFVFCCLTTVLLPGCATAPKPPPAGSVQGQILDMGEYTVSPPPGDDWSIEKNPDAGSVTFSRKKVWFTGRVLGATIISVMKNQVMGDAPLLDEESEANRFRDREETGMIKLGVETGQYKLSDVRREKVTLDDRQYYLLRYKQTIPRGALEPAIQVEASLYILYPPDFQKRRVFYLFHISDSKENYSAAAIDIRQIEPVIRSFRSR